MKDPNQLLKQIEISFDVNSIRWNNISLWPVLRIYILMHCVLAK